MRYSNQHIKVVIRREAGCYVIEVSDKGKGITPQDLSEYVPLMEGRSEMVQKIFAFKFSKVQQSTMRGIGLTVCYLIAKSHHGTITVESEPGKGTTFTVKLPEEGDINPPQQYENAATPQHKTAAAIEAAA